VFFPLFLLLLALLSACAPAPAPAPTPDGSVEVWYLTDWKTNDAAANLLASLALVPDGEHPEDLVGFCLAQLFADPDDGELRSPFPSGTAAVSHTLEDGQLTLDLSKDFTALTGPELTMAEACLTLTLCALPGVSAVQITVNGLPWPLPGKNRFTAADFSLDALVLKPVDRPLTLFFVDTDTLELKAEIQLVPMRDTEPAERYVLEALFNAPKTAGLHSALPQDAPQPQASIDKGICYVNFPAGFYDSQPPFTYELAIQAITRSLTALPGIEAVQFLSDGQNAVAYGDVRLDEPVSYNS